MSLSNEQFNAALEIFIEWGPELRKPVEQRWKERLPEIPESEYFELAIQCTAIQSYSYFLADKVRDGVLSTEAGRYQFCERYPHLDDERQSHLWSQAMYYSMK